MAKRANKKNLNDKNQYESRLILYYLQKFWKLTVIILTLLCIGSWIYFSGTLGKIADTVSSKYHEIAVNHGFSVQNIPVTGRNNVKSEDLLAALDVNKGDSILSFDPVKAHKAIKEIPWVKSVVITRILPDTIYVKLEERVPVFIWKKNRDDKSEYALYDESGFLLSDQDVKSYGDFPVLYGEGATEKASEFFSFLENSEFISQRMKYGELIANRRWNITLNNNLIIKLPETKVKEALMIIENNHRNHKLLDKDIYEIDLRNPDKMIVRPKRGSAGNILP